MGSRQWREVSDFVARFCKLRKSENTRTCENCTRNFVCFLTRATCKKVWLKSYTSGHCLTLGRGFHASDSCGRTALNLASLEGQCRPQCHTEMVTFTCYNTKVQDNEGLELLQEEMMNSSTITTGFFQGRSPPIRHCIGFFEKSAAPSALSR